MKYEPIPVTRQLITWARDRAGFTLADAAEKFKSIEAWEAGDAYPSYPQLERMAHEFKVPVAVFFFPEPPDLPKISETFRTIREADFEVLPRRIRILLRKAKAFQINVSELTDGRNPADRMITRELAIKRSASIKTLAKRVREYLGVSMETQCGWPSAQEALKNWRDILQTVGIAVFKDQFREDKFSGFCLYDDEFPLIYVNNSTSKTRQIFTLFHELAHLLFHTSGIDGLTDDVISTLTGKSQAIERTCNGFAAEFLLPDAVFEQVLVGINANEASAVAIAGRFHVSREVVFRKFVDRDLITQRTYDAARERWNNQRTGGSGGNSYYNQIAYLGRDYINLAFSQYYKNRITDTQLAEYLDMKPRHVSTLEDYVFRGV